MTRQVKIGEAKTHLSALLAEVEAGENLVICCGALQGIGCIRSKDWGPPLSD